MYYNSYYNNYQDTVNQIQSLESELIDQNQDSMKTIVGKTIDYIDDVNKFGTGLSSGFESLDALTNGFREGSLNVLAGRPAMGKSTLALNIASHLSDIICVDDGSSVPSYSFIKPANMWGSFKLTFEQWAMAAIADTSGCVIMRKVDALIFAFL